MKLRVAVVGAGVIGLSTAVCIQEELVGVDVTIIADKFDASTTSDGAAGMFRANQDDVPGVPDHVFRQWCEDGFRHYKEIAMSSESPVAGVSVIDGYHFFKDPLYIKKPVLSEILPQFRESTPKELSFYPGQPFKRGYTFTTFLIECRWYLPWLAKRFKKNGGRIQERNIKSFSELCGHYDIVVNCTGLASRWLANDKEIIAMRGQILKVHAPWIKRVFFVNKDTVVIPGKEFVSVGVTKQLDNYNLEIDENDTKKIWDRILPYIPSLKHAKVLYTWVGLRPYRPKGLRLEHETMVFGSKQLEVVHNYGHGGHGVGLSWGTAAHATRLVKTLSSKLRVQNTPAKL